jgi:hypothetical protein
MTEMIIENEMPPSSIIDDAERIADKTIATRVEVEDAVDNKWFIRVEGPTAASEDEDGLTRESFESLYETTSGLVEGDNTAFKTYYGVGPTDNKYLVRIEY